MKDKMHRKGRGRMSSKPKAPDGAYKGLGKGMSEKDLGRGYTKP